MNTNFLKSRNAFKAYDIRGRVPEELNVEVAYRIGRAYAEIFKPSNIVVGYDIRLSSPDLCEALSRGLMDEGCNVIDIGLCGTEQIYFSTFHLELDGGIMVTASHNPQNYNGMKLVRQGAKPISGDSGLREIEERVVNGYFKTSVEKGKGAYRKLENKKQYIDHLLSYVDRALLKPLKVVVNAGNGCAGSVIDALENHLPFQFIKVHHHPDGSFPNGIPNPLLPENRKATSEMVLKVGADVGIAWDGDFDRCFFFDEKGDFIEGYYIVGLLAQSILRQCSGAKIIHDPRLTWNTIDLVNKANGIPVQSKTGHAFIKERMRLEDAIYGGEMSAHHYFKKFAYCDSGMIPWLLVLEMMCKRNKSLSELIGERICIYPASGEINRRVSNPKEVMIKIENKYLHKNPKIDRTDGISLEFSTWRFNLRMSNTESVIRLNVESRNDKELLTVKTKEVLDYIDSATSTVVPY